MSKKKSKGRSDAGWMTDEERLLPALTLDQFISFASQCGPSTGARLWISPALEQFRSWWRAGMATGHPTFAPELRASEWLVLFAIFLGDDSDPRFQPIASE